MLSRIVFILFVADALLNLYSQFTSNESIAFYTKPLLMLLLACWLYLKTGFRTRLQQLAFGALVFSFGGDTLLMLVEARGELFFLLGLASFLIAHIFYATGFWGRRKGEPGFVQRNKVWSIPLLIYTGLLMGYLYPGIPDEMRIPVLIYGLVITIMALTVLNLKGLLDSGMFRLLMLGVLLFIISDSLIALTKFQSGQPTIPMPRFWIMLLYILGQSLIILGVAQDREDYA